MFNYSLIRYNISHIIDATDNVELIQGYRIMFNTFEYTHLVNMYEWLRTLSTQQLTEIKLKFEPRSDDYHEAFYIIAKSSNLNIDIRYCLVFKNDNFTPPQYTVVR